MCLSASWFHDFLQELDLTSTFVSKAALIAKRKLEQKHTFEKEKKKSPGKVKPKSVLDKEELALKEAQKKVRTFRCSPSRSDVCKVHNRHLVPFFFRILSLLPASLLKIK